MFVYDGTEYAYPQLPAYFPEPRRRGRPAGSKSKGPRKGKRRAAREVNYASKNRPATQALHDRIAELLSGCAGVTVRDIATVLGISRQLCLYHIKKMVAHGRLLAELAPCEGNGGVQYVVWEKVQRAIELAVWLKETTGLAA